MGKVNTQYLNKAASIEDVARHITSKGWGVCYINGNTILTNIPGFFIGEQGKNIFAFRHLGVFSVVSFESKGMIKKHPYDKSFPYIRAKCGPAIWANYHIPNEMFEFIENSKQFGF